jgi:hypothetical protein
MRDRRAAVLFCSVLSALLVSSARAGGPAKTRAESLWPASTPHVWSYSGHLKVEGADREIRYSVRTRDKETVDGQTVYGLDTVSASGRVLATEWFAYEPTKVLLVRHQSGDEAARTLDPPQPFLDTAQIETGKSWSWSSKDGSEHVESTPLPAEPVTGGDGVVRTCLVVEIKIEFRATRGSDGKDGKATHEQVRRVWLAPDVGLVHEISSTRTAGMDGALETETDVTLAKVTSRDGEK